MNIQRKRKKEKKIPVYISKHKSDANVKIHKKTKQVMYWELCPSGKLKDKKHTSDLNMKKKDENKIKIEYINKGLNTDLMRVG